LLLSDNSLKASHNSWLTVENFGNKLTAAAGIMKKKQIFFLEKTEGKDEIAIRTHLGRYLRCDGDGEFKADGDQGDDETFWNIEAQADGRWALKSTKYGWYAGAAGKEIEGARQCFEKEITEVKLFTVKLAMHPMVTIQNVKRTTFLHTNDTGDSLTTDEVVPWGDDAVIMLVFNEDNGTYCIQANNAKVLSNTGALAAERVGDGSCDYILEFHGGVIAFKNLKSGKYVTSLGGQGLAKATKSAVTKDEKYEMHNSYPQITLQAFNKKFVSCKQGIELAATAPSASTDQEIFQLEPLDNGNWTITAATLSSINPDTWVTTEDGGIQTSPDGVGATEFGIEFLGPNVAFKAANGKYITQQKNSYLKATATEPTGEALFAFTVVNRPRLVLRGVFGFVNTLPSGLLECNKSDFETFNLETSPEGVAITDSKGKYWAVGDGAISAKGDAPEWYTIELFKNSKLTIKHGSNLFKGAQNGAFTATGSSPDQHTLFEY
jgi:fascin 1/2